MSTQQTYSAKIAVVGGGIAGATIALYLSELDLDVTLFEKNKSLVSGPPICHLHAGGNLYREISDDQCLSLLNESIDLVRFYPDAVDYRPTVIAVPTKDKGLPQNLYRRLKLLKEAYISLIDKDAQNQVLGVPSTYYSLYSEAKLRSLKRLSAVAQPTTLDEWMIPVAQNLDFSKVKFPLIAVQEYGLNLFRLGATATIALQKCPHTRLLLEHKVTAIEKIQEQYQLTYTHHKVKKEEQFDFLINAAGFRSGTLDDMLGYTRERLVEFKAAYVTQWPQQKMPWPELIFFGERGTPQGMAQFTPYPDGHVQLHGMTKEITLFEEGLVKSTQESAQPQLQPKLLEKIEQDWDLNQAKARSQRAIKHLATFIPSFQEAQVVSKPLYGAQQIPGDDETLRAAEVSFVDERYARCEIVKASSVLSMADAITKKLIDLGYVKSSDYQSRQRQHITQIKPEEIQTLAQELTQQRAYPLALAHVVKASNTPL